MSKKILTTLLLSGIIMMGMTTAAFAKDVPTVGTGTEDSGAKVSITKNLELAEGITIPTATFKFTAEKITTDAPNATIKPINYSNSDSKGDLEGGKYTISKDSEIEFGKFPHAGLYQYNVTETNEDMEGIIYSTTTYKINVYVANKDNGDTYIKTITAEDQGTKKDKILFTNTYVKNNASLIIEKKTVGDLADKTKDFEFTINLIKSATVTENNPTYTGMIGDEEVSVTVGTPTTFKLHDGENLVFSNIPAGTRYVVTEKGVADGYVASVQVTENNVQGSLIKGDDENNLSSSADGNNLIGEGTNKVEFINKYNEVPITGVIMNNLPFILLIGVAVLGFGSLAVVKKRKSVR